MRLKRVKLTHELLDTLLVEPGQEAFVHVFAPATIRDDVMAREYSYALVNAFGRPIVVGGLVEYWDGRAEGWGLFSSSAKEYGKDINELVLAFLDEVPVKRIEATVDTAFEKGIRWAERMGFKKEAVMPAYRYGRDHVLYSRIKEA